MRGFDVSCGGAMLGIPLRLPRTVLIIMCRHSQQYNSREWGHLQFRGSGRWLIMNQLEDVTRPDISYLWQKRVTGVLVLSRTRCLSCLILSPLLHTAYSTSTVVKTTHSNGQTEFFRLDSRRQWGRGWCLYQSCVLREQRLDVLTKFVLH